jgi:hypothetical protein
MTARLIQDGAGFRFLQQNCATKPYTVCKFMDRLPADVNVFLWSKDPKYGVFNLADLSTRTALSSEQVAFAWDVLKFDPVRVITVALGNLVVEVRNIGLIEFFFTPETVQAFKQALPDQYYGNLQRSHLIFHNWILTLGTVYAAFYYVSAVILLLCLVLLPHLRAHSTFDGLDAAERQHWLSIFFIVLTAMICNAAVCGTLSGPFPRYQTRISWVPFFVLCLFVASISAHLLPKKTVGSPAG